MSVCSARKCVNADFFFNSDASWKMSKATISNRQRNNPCDVACMEETPFSKVKRTAFIISKRRIFRWYMWCLCQCDLHRLECGSIDSSVLSRLESAPFVWFCVRASIRPSALNLFWIAPRHTLIYWVRRKKGQPFRVEIFRKYPLPAWLDWLRRIRITHIYACWLLLTERNPLDRFVRPLVFPATHSVAGRQIKW